ncbi:hypothetical protein Tco_0825630, partial [Tanacetum coccineum]
MAGNSSNNSTNSNSSENTTNLDEINSNDPLYLHQTHYLGLILISNKLIGSDNYSSWKRKVQPVKQFKATKVVNMMVTQDEANKPITLGQAATPSEYHVSARMDQLQNQLNQVMLMLQQKGSH